MSSTLLITRPNNDPGTYYLFWWSKHIIEECKRKGFSLIDLTKDKANKKRFLGILQKKADAKMLVVMNGHGNDNFIAGQGNDPLISFQEAGLLSNKIVYARACNSLNVLGKKAVDEGALAYIGYDIPFTFYKENEKLSKPLQDRTAELFLDPSNYVAISLIKGHSAGMANLRSRVKFRDNVRKLLIDGQTSPYFYTIGDLYNNMMHQICLGDKEAKL
ncbi:MAG: hypothetical protein AAB415_02370 [Patescibacteria group bacterium]